MTEPVYHPSFKPPFMPREQALLLNALLLRSSPWHIPFGSGEMLVSPLTDVPSFSPACAISLDIDGASWQMELDNTAALLRHTAFAESDGSAPVFDERSLPSEVRRALLESLLEPLLSALRSALNKALSIREVTFLASPERKAVYAGFKAVLSPCNGLPELTTFVRLSPLHAEDASGITASVRTYPIRQEGPLTPTLNTVPLEVAIESGYLFLNAEEVAGLSPEDVLLPDVWTAPETLTLRIRRADAPALTASCSVEGVQVTLSSPLSEESASSMDNAELKDIDIRLSFELDRRTITVGELEALAPGYTFALDCDASSPVTIRANGKAIARGRLVDMNGVLGVQISETL